jgi:hypothetical protein
MLQRNTTRQFGRKRNGGRSIISLDQHALRRLIDFGAGKLDSAPRYCTT